MHPLLVLIANATEPKLAKHMEHIIVLSRFPAASIARA